MADELRERLRTVDETAPSIQGAANAMMKHYDRSTTSIAVNEWRNALFSATSGSQYIPLLYVANEVLQNSKRNRGNKFLESFSPILLQSLIYMVQQIHQQQQQQSPSTTTAIAQVERIRRVIKIWADRRVFSTRFVNEVLTGLEPYRTSAAVAPQPSSPPPPVAAAAAATTTASTEMATFSPPVETNEHGSTTNLDDSLQTTVSHEDILGILEAHEREKYTNHRSSSNDDTNHHHPNNDDDDDDDDDLFADHNNNSDSGDMMIGDDSEQHPSLSIDVNVTDAVAQLVQARNSRHNSSNKRRRRSSAGSGKSDRRGSSNQINNAKSSLSNFNFLEIWNQLAENQQKYDLALTVIQQIQTHIASVPDDELSNLVGDELQQAVQQNESDLKRLVEQRRILHGLANERYLLGLEATRYIPWLEASIRQDTDDIQFSTTLEEKIRQCRPIFPTLQATRTMIRQEQQRLGEIQAEQQRRQREAEENEKFKRDILARQTEAKPGMVWNPTTREYQALNTDESWRD